MRFGGLVAVNDLSFVARHGEITALIGPNGAGKTTVFNCITGFYKPTEGRIALQTATPAIWQRARGADRSRHAQRRAARTARCSCSNACPTTWWRSKARVARTFQNIRLFRGMTVLENLLVAQHNSLMRASGFTIFGMFGFRCYARAERAAIDKARALARNDRADRPRRRSGRRTALWRPAPPRNRARDVHRSGAAVPRRAGRGAQSARKRRILRAADLDPRRARDLGAADRARHVGGDADFRSRHRAGLRRQDLRRHPAIRSATIRT